MNRSRFLALCGIVVVIAAGLLAYSQTLAFASDEGYHVVTAQLITRGKRPYIDFTFPQTPLNAYWNAAWMRIFGDTWRVTHVAATLLSAGAILLTADYLRKRFPVAGWTWPCTIAAALLCGLNSMVVQWGTVAQSYGFSLFFSVAAYRLSVIAVDSSSLLLAFAAGICAGAAPAGTLLTAPVPVILFLWILFYNRVRNRATKAVVFLAGAALPFAPLAWLFLQGPRQTVFSIFEYQFRYRQVQWPGAGRHNFEVIMSWIDCPQALLLILLAAAGVIFVRSRADWDRNQRGEYYLCLWLAIVLAVHVSVAKPTFQRYYVFTVPFLSILAAVGLYVVASRLGAPDRPRRAVAVLGALMVLTLGKSLYERHDGFTSQNFAWWDYEQIASKVDRVSPPGAAILADEQVYFITRRPPPSGMELSDSHKFESLPPAFASLVHIVQGPELERRIKAGEYSTLETCDDEEGIKKRGLDKLYSQRQEVSSCMVLWDLKPARIRENTP